MSTPAAGPVPRLLHGSLITIARRCGKPNCRCAAGDDDDLHESPALSASVKGKSVTVSLRTGEVAGVSEALERYRAARAELNAQAAAGVAALRARKTRRRARRQSLTAWLGLLALARRGVHQAGLRPVRRPADRVGCARAGGR